MNDIGESVEDRWDRLNGSGRLEILEELVLLGFGVLAEDIVTREGDWVRTELAALHRPWLVRRRICEYAGVESIRKWA